jgi:hypothetical protein
MDDDLRDWLFDPPTTRGLVLAHRPPERSAVQCVVSDVVWHDVVRLLRWATADTGRDARLDGGRWWRLAAGCADLLRRLPGLADELDQPWRSVDAAPTAAGAAGVGIAAGRLTRALRSSGPLPLAALAAEIDALGAAAISALAERSSWTVPDTP